MNIDADKLKAEIERLYYNEAEKDESILAADAYKNALDAVEKFLDHLQQEKPEAGFEKEWQSYVDSRKDDLSGDMVSVNIKDVALRYYELGQLVMKHSITNRAKVALAKCHTFSDTTYFAIGEVLSFILDRTDKEE